MVSTSYTLDNYRIEWEVVSPATLPVGSSNSAENEGQEHEKEKEKEKEKVEASEEGNDGVGVRVVAEDVVTKEVFVKFIPQKEVPSLTQNLIDDCDGLAMLLETSLSKATDAHHHTSVSTKLVAKSGPWLSSSSLSLVFEHRTVFKKTFKFEILLERSRSTSATTGDTSELEARFDRVARSLHQQLVVAQNDIRHLSEENATLKTEVERLERERVALTSLRTPFFAFELIKQQMLQWNELETKESLFSMITYLLFNGLRGYNRLQPPQATICFVSKVPGNPNEDWKWRWANYNSPYQNFCSGATVEVNAWPFLKDAAKRLEFVQEAEAMGLRVNIVIPTQVHLSQIQKLECTLMTVG